MSVTEPGGAKLPGAPISLDGLAVGVDLLDAVLVFHLSDANLHALWVRPESGLRADEVVTTLRDLYRVGQFAAKRLSPSAPRSEAPAPLLTLEMLQRTAVLRRIRAHVVAGVFDAAMPLGMARLIADRLAAAIGPELPLEPDPSEVARIRVPTPAAQPEPVVRSSADEPAPNTLSFGSALPRRSHPPPPPAEMDRVSRLLAYLAQHAPEPHVVRDRLALRAGLTLAALEHPESLGAEAVILMETAVQDILGIDRAELRRIA